MGLKPIDFGGWKWFPRGDGNVGATKIERPDENTFKGTTTIPLLTEEEIRDIDNNMDKIISEFTKQFIHSKELAIAQHIIEKQASTANTINHNYSILLEQNGRLLEKNNKLKQENGKLKSENAALKEQLQYFIPRRRVRRVYKQLKKILEQDGITDDLDIED